jgi:recombinational DNA repair ATPase RecF
MENFMTYTDVTVEPGPRLNLILGPNGTGMRALSRATALLRLSRACA